jgi:microcystin-dependent protein
MPISQNTALFALLGTTYGGDGKSTFALPNLQGSAPMHPGQGPGLSLHDLGEMSGSATVTLLEAEIPGHAHTLMAGADPANAQIPNSQVILTRSSGGSAYNPTATGVVAMNPLALGLAGGSQPHNNMQPYLAVNFCIALQGVFPSRS